MKIKQFMNKGREKEMSKKTTVLCIMDGYGLRKEKENNAIAMANKPNIDKIFDEYAMVEGFASGVYVGLPEDQMGNSEVGHLNIGAGRVVYQDLTRITKAIEDESFFANVAFMKAVDNVKQNNSSLHIMGLLSDGGVHTHNSHLYALLELAKMNNLEKVYIHCFLDGRDTPPKSGIDYLKELESKIEEIGVGKIVSICGRYYAMDRDKNYDRTQLAYDLLTKCKGTKYNNSNEAISASYANDITDEFVKPCVVGDDNAKVSDNDSLIFFNFRPDRARQITHAFCDDDFIFFDRQKLKGLIYVCMTEYDPTIKGKLVAFEEKVINNHLGEVIGKKGLMQLRTAETEKYAHVTFFFNGGVEKECINEDRILVPSPKEVPTYDLKPEMSAIKVCDNVVNAIDSGKYDLIVVNFANPDMVGHTGVLPAAIKAIETVDKCVGRIFDKIIEKKGNLFIIADHGNAELMKDENGNPYTAHTNNPVPFCLVTPEKYKLKTGGRLCDVAPTILKLMGIEQPEEMTGVALI